MDPQYYARAIRLYGRDHINQWISDGDWSDDFNPIHHIDMSEWDTAAKREDVYEKFKAHERSNGLRRTGSIAIKIHANYTLASIESHIREMESYIIETMLAISSGNKIDKAYFGTFRPEVNTMLQNMVDYF